MLGKTNAGTATKEEKTVTASTNQIEISPSKGKLLSKVTVNPTPSQTKNIMPAKSQQTVLPDDGKLLSSVTVAGDSDLVAANIRHGVNIFGVVGNVKERFPNGTLWEESSTTTSRRATSYFVKENGICLISLQDSIRRSVDGGRNWSTVLGARSCVITYSVAQQLWVSGGTQGLYYSTDNGVTWTQSNITSGDFYGVLYENNIWVAGSSDDMYYSTDGKSWTKATGSAKSDGYGSPGNCLLAYANGVFVVGTALEIYYSTTGKSWTKTTASIPGYSIQYIDGIWLASQKGYFYYSYDGKTWTQGNLQYTNYNYWYPPIIRVDGKFILPAASSGLYYSNDGKTWEQKTGVPACKWLEYNNGLYIGATDNGVVYSSDLNAWSEVSFGDEGGTSIIKFLDSGAWVACSNSVATGVARPIIHRSDAWKNE